jgi:hypothetical protein
MFEMEVSKLPRSRGDEGYGTAELNASMVRAKKETLSLIPKADKPLRDYIAREFPSPEDPSSDVVSTQRAETLFERVRTLLSKLSRLDSFRFDLKVMSSPPKARFDLVPHVGERISVTTNTSVTNVYRGEYEYHLSKAGYKPVRATINFIDRTGTLLECELQLESSQQEALPCNFR